MRSALLAIIAVAATGPAHAVTHAETGFGIAPPFPFTAEPVPFPGTDAAFGIVSRVSKPTPPEDDPYLCLLTYVRDVAGEGVDQANINARFASEDYQEATRARVADTFELASSTTFEDQGIVGFEMIGTPKGREGGSDVRLFVSLLETPRAVISMSCATTADQIDSATGIFRMLRQTIIVPQDQ